MVVKQESRRGRTVFVLYNASETRLLGVYKTEYQARKAEKEMKQKLATVEVKGDKERKKKG